MSCMTARLLSRARLCIPLRQASQAAHSSRRPPRRAAQAATSAVNCSTLAASAVHCSDEEAAFPTCAKGRVIQPSFSTQKWKRNRTKRCLIRRS